MMKAKVLITGAGGAAAVAFLGAVRQHLEFTYFMGDIDPFAAGLYLVEETQRLILPRADDPHFAEKMLEICFDNAIDLLVPTVDAELLPLAETIRLFEEIGVGILLADERTLRICLDKNVLMETCAGQIAVPRSAVLDEKFDDEGWEYPLFVKPREGSGSRGIEKIDSPADLIGQRRDGSLLIQEYLDGAEYSVDVLADRNGEILAAVPRERLKIDSGIAVAARTLKDAELEQQAVAVARLIGLKYTANIQFKRNRKGTPCLLEVNPRFPGTMPLTVESGVNMPLISLQDVLDLPIADKRPEWRELAVVRTWQEHFVSAAEIREMELKCELKAKAHFAVF